MVNFHVDWTALAAAATAMAVMVTAWMAKETRKAAKAAQTSVEQSAVELGLIDKQTSAITEQARLARLALTRGDRPLLIPVGWDEQAVLSSASTSSSSFDLTLRTWDKQEITLNGQVYFRGCWIVLHETTLWLLLEMRNVGSGLALVRDPSIGPTEQLSPGSLGGQFLSELISEPHRNPRSQALWSQQPVIPPGESTRFVACINDPNTSAWKQIFENEPTDNPVTIKCQFHYQDLSGTQFYSVFVTCSLRQPARFDIGREPLVPGPPKFKGYEIPQPQIDSKDTQK